MGLGGGFGEGRMGSGDGKEYDHTKGFFDRSGSM